MNKRAQLIIQGIRKSNEHWMNVESLAALLVCDGGPKTTFTCQKKKKKLFMQNFFYINNHFKLICFATILTWK